MNAKQLIAFGAVLLLALCLAPAADGASIDTPDTHVTVDNMNGGSYTFEVYSETGFEMTVTLTENGRVISTQEFTVNPGENDISIDLGMVSSVGTHTIRVECSPADEFPASQNRFNLTVTVEQNILSNWAVYGAIAVVVIIIAIFAYIKLRDNPRAKPEMTFEELEAQRKADMAEKAARKEKKPAKASSTERKRYTGGKDAEAPAEKPRKSEGLRDAPAEKPKEQPKKEERKPTFEELEAQKQAEKAAKKEKKSSGKSERERYLEEKRKKKEQE